MKKTRPHARSESATRYPAAPLRSKFTSRQGFVLLSVVGLLIVVGFILTQIARLGLRTSLAARERTKQLQSDWARLSCERAILPHGARVFQMYEQASASVRTEGSRPARTPLISLAGSIRLGETSVSLLLGDENAKLNINLLQRHRGTFQTDATMKRLVPPTYGIAQQLLPGNGGQPFQSWGQVYAFHGSSPTARRLFLNRVTQSFTCWGPQTINYRRCDPRSLRTAMRLVLSRSQADELAEAVIEQGHTDLNALMIGREFSRRDRDGVIALLTAESTCFSLKTDCVSDSGISTCVAILDQPTHTEGDAQPTIERYLIP